MSTSSGLRPSSAARDRAARAPCRRSGRRPARRARSRDASGRSTVRRAAAATTMAAAWLAGVGAGREEPRRIGGELRQAVRAAEVVGLPGVRVAAGRARRLDGHAADGIDHRRIESSAGGSCARCAPRGRDDARPAPGPRPARSRRSRSRARRCSRTGSATPAGASSTANQVPAAMTICGRSPAATSRPSRRTSPPARRAQQQHVERPALVEMKQLVRLQPVQVRRRLRARDQEIDRRAGGARAAVRHAASTASGAR